MCFDHLASFREHAVKNETLNHQIPTQYAFQQRGKRISICCNHLSGIVIIVKGSPLVS